MARGARSSSRSAHTVPPGDPLALTFGDGRSAEVLRRLELTVNRRLDGLLQGDYGGLVPGHGSEPGETRAYQPGDDVRRIDWNVTARTQQTHIRETIADRELETWVLFDQSASLDFGTAKLAKRDLAVIAFAAVGFLSARTGNRLGAVLTGREGRGVVIPARSGRNHLLAGLRCAMDPPDPAAAPSGSTELGDAVCRVASLHRRRGLAVVISDFLARDGWEASLPRLTARHDTLAIEIVDPRELDLPSVGVLTLVDPETGRRRDVQTASARLRARYAEAAAAQRADIAARLRRAGADHLLLRTDRDWLADLVRFVALRRQRAARLPRRSR